MPKYEVEVRVTARYFVECDEEVASTPEEAVDYVEGLSDSEITESYNVEVDAVEVIGANEV